MQPPAVLYLCSCCGSWVYFQRAVIVVFCNIDGLSLGIQQGFSGPLARKALLALAPSLCCLQNVPISVNTSHKKTSWHTSYRKELGLNFWVHKLCHRSSKMGLYLYMAANTTRKQQYLLLQAWPVWLSPSLASQDSHPACSLAFSFWCSTKGPESCFVEFKSHQEISYFEMGFFDFFFVYIG